MHRLFSTCASLISLPDISKWDTTNVEEMDSMFEKCSSLISLPDLSKWNISNVRNISGMFFCCSSLLSLPDISKWNIQNITDLVHVFEGCLSISSLPDISNWNTYNISSLTKMLSYCSSLASLPDLSKWNMNNIINSSNKEVFYNCPSSLNFPKSSPWDKEFFFIEEEKTRSVLPYIPYNTESIKNLNYLLDNDFSLEYLPKVSQRAYTYLNNACIP